jgi:hypothetical protein
MRPGNFFIAFICDAVLIALLAMQASCAAPPGIGTQIASPPDAREARMENTASQADGGELVPAIRELDAVQETPMQDGPALLKSHCARCHATAWFDQIDKSRAEWETVLERMKSLGVQLSDTEKDILLDYLVAANQP